jgi:SAM-dependent methyltransferase
VRASPVPLTGRTVADLGAGTGATSRAIAEAGGRPVAIDSSLAMLAHRRRARSPAIVADLLALPLADASVGAAVGAFSFSHLEVPGVALAEAVRVTAPGGPVLVGTFGTTGARHEAKNVLDELARDRGWAPPDWYLRLKEELESRVARADKIEALAGTAGLGSAEVREMVVDTGLDTPEALVAWRAAGPAMAPWLSGLDADERAGVLAAAVAEMGERSEPLRPFVLVLAGVVPRQLTRGERRARRVARPR